MEMIMKRPTIKYSGLKHIGRITTLMMLVYVQAVAQDKGAAVLLVDMDRKMGQVNENLYGHFLEHINHSVVDGL